MKKRLLFAIILTVALVTIIVILFFVIPKEFSDKDILENPDKAMEFCKNSLLNKGDDCYYKISQVLSADNTNVSIQACLAILNDGFKKQCIGDLANSGDLSIDTRLSICDARTGSDKDNCYMGIVDGLWETEPSKGLEICKKISDSNTKNGCLNNFMGSPELIRANPTIAEEVCSLSSLLMKSNCYNNFARALSVSDPKKAAEVCKKLSDDVQISDCYGNVWFSFDSVILQNYDFAISLCNVLTLKKDDCLRRTSEVFMNSDKAKAEAICKLMSASASSGCLNNIQR